MLMTTVFPSKYIKVAELGDKPTLYTISHVEMETMGFGQDKKTAPVLYFREIERGLVLNRTNNNTIIDAYGDESETWRGKPIVLVPTDVEYKGKLQPGIRLRQPKASDKSAITTPASITQDQLDDSEIPF
jgi:hypothetical protein